MSASRYRNDPPIRGGKLKSSARACARIRLAVKSGELATRKVTLKEGERLDQLAGEAYGDGSLWWVIAAASNIGWWLQAPPGTIITIPTDLRRVMRFV